MLAPSPLAHAPAWHVLLTHPREERKAAASLTGYRIEVYLPEISHRRIRHGRRMEDCLEPMMPGYLFIRSAPLIPWGRIRTTPGIRCQRDGLPVLMNDGRAARVPDWAIQVVMAKEGRLQKGLERLSTGLKVGQTVEVVEGPFAWFRGVIDDLCKLDTNGRLWAMMDIFGRLTRVEFEVSQVRTV